MNPKIKICGLTNQEAVDAAVEYGAAFLGFVFYPPSPRHVSPDLAYAFTDSLKKPVGTVAVVVDPPEDALLRILEHFVPGCIQLHGAESPDDVKRIRAFLHKQSLGHIHIIKAIAIRSAQDIKTAADYEAVADMLLFDARPVHSDLPGGNGLTFDWRLLHNATFGKPWFLSGGLTPGNVAEALRITQAPMADVSSGVEYAPGLKDPRLIKEFIEQAKSV